MKRKILSLTLCLIIIFFALIPQQKSYAQNGYHIASLNLVPTGVSEVEALVLSERLSYCIYRIISSPQYLSVKEADRYTEILEREQMDRIFEQFEIQNTGCVSDSCAVEFGKMLQVDRIVIGSVGKIGDTYTLSDRIIDVGSAITINNVIRDHKGSIDALPGSIIQDLANELLRIHPDWENYELISIDGFRKTATVYIDDKLFSETPISNELISKGYHLIRIENNGFEKFITNINVESGNPIKLSYDLIPITRSRIFRKSIIFPGSGQRYAGHKIKGNIISILQAVTIAGVIGSSFMHSDAIDKYDNANNSYLTLKSNSIEDYDRAFKKAQDIYNDADSFKNLYLISIGAAMCIYVWNVIDASFTKPEAEINQKRFSLDINPSLDGALSCIYVRMRY